MSLIISILLPLVSCLTTLLHEIPSGGQVTVGQALSCKPVTVSEACKALKLLGNRKSAVLITWTLTF